MGDRTYVRLCVPTEYKELVLSLIEAAPDDEWGDEELVTFGFVEVNYGELNDLPKLQHAGIPYDQEWDAGGSYGAGTQHCRFTEKGEIQLKVVMDEDFNPNIGSLMNLIDDYESLRSHILVHHERVTPLPWDSQVEYGKKYRTLQLLKPNHG